jgi:hypothetical protein
VAQKDGKKKTDEAWAALKVHKNDNFFGFDFEFCTISMLVMHNNKNLVKKFF